MKRLIVTITILITCVFSGCEISVKPAVLSDNSISLNEQTFEQLGIASEEDRGDYVPLNYEKQVGMWLTYMDYNNIFSGKSENEFIESLGKVLEQVKGMGVNTIYVHVRAFGDSYYASDIFPPSEKLSVEYDYLKIITEMAHDADISVHAWINPLRCSTEDGMKALDDKWLEKKWYNEKKGSYIVKVGDYYYLNPAYSEVRTLIAAGFYEIAQKYDVDGFHIDDYFYPTTEESFDAAAFSMSESNNLGDWRRNNITLMIEEINMAVKGVDEALEFGISPQGNIHSNVNTQYADVEKWVSDGLCDYIVPQLYYGFENESCPFESTLSDWMKLVGENETRLVVGICTYKIGQEDKWAGSGKNEWIENENIPARQAVYAAEKGLGIAVYSFGSTFTDAVISEQKSLSEAINKHYGGGD